MSRFARPRALATFAAGTTVAATAIYYASFKFAPLALDANRDVDHASNKRPAVLWTPPSRKEIIDALKGSLLVPSSSPLDIDGNSAPESADSEYDLLVIGGGATGTGIALDAATRGLKVALVERGDFSSGTSSKSTKLVHGGVRYLQKAIFELDYEQYKLVREALHERKTFLHIAPYLSLHLPIMLPVYKWWQVPYYYAGCKMYDLLAGGENMESSYVLGKGKALENFPMLNGEGLAGAVVYYDGQHNDARMNMALAMSAVHHGAVLANYAEVTALHKEGGQVRGAMIKDALTGEEFNIRAKGVINATGPFCDGVRKLDDPSVKEIVAPSGGVHITLPSYYAPKHMGLLDPATSDGRVIFFLPWQGNAIAGTTDSPAPVEQDPMPKEEEIQWILGEVRNYLSPDIKVRRGDVLSAWSGIRPLVRNPAAKDSQSLVRNHMINVSSSGLLTISGGKWTTYRAMAEETVDEAVKVFGLMPNGPCVTTHVQLIGSHGWHKSMFIKLIQQFGLDSDVAKHLMDTYGDRAWAVCAMAKPTGQRWPVHGTRLDKSYPYLEEEVRYACQNEYAQAATDIIGRRTRLSFLNAQAALEVLPRVIDIMSEEKSWNDDEKERQFEIAKSYLLTMGLPKVKSTLTFDQVRKGMVGSQVQEEGQVFSRAMFSPEELDQLRRQFSSIDTNHDGVIDPSDLAQAIRKLDFPNVPSNSLDQVITKSNISNRTKSVDLSEFLDMAASVKEISLSNKLNHSVKGDLNESQQTIPFVKNSSQDTKAQWARKIPVERSGGGT